MDVYLIQHGQALSAERDSERPLSDEGRAAASKTAHYLAALRDRLIAAPILEIRHSGKVRARQTAEVFARALAPGLEPTEGRAMSPNDDPRAMHDELEARRGADGALFLVGHLPHLAYLAGLLLAGDAGQTPIHLVNAGVLKLQPAPAGWMVEWYLTAACVK